MTDFNVTGEMVREAWGAEGRPEALPPHLQRMNEIAEQSRARVRQHEAEMETVHRCHAIQRTADAYHQRAQERQEAPRREPRREVGSFAL